MRRFIFLTVLCSCAAPPEEIESIIRKKEFLARQWECLDMQHNLMVSGKKDAGRFLDSLHRNAAEPCHCMDSVLVMPK